jgi:hypothetical protein
MPHSHHLLRNPFGESFDHEMVGAQRKKVADEIIKMVENACRDQLQILGRIDGTYGEGKTFTLMKLEEKLKDPREFVRVTESKETRNVAVAILKSSEARAATNYSLYLYQKILDGLGLDFFHILRARLETMAETTKQFETTILASLDDDFSNVFIVLRDKEIIAWDWLRGQKLGAKELKDLRVNRNIDNSTARKYLVELLELLRILGYDALVVLVDEVEYLMHFGNKKAVEMFVTFKEIYDIAESAKKTRKIVPVVQILAFAPETWEDLIKLKEKLENRGASVAGLQPFIDRIKGWTTFKLEDLASDDIRDLIVELLKLGRPKDTKEGINNSIYPFEEGAIKYIAEKSLGVPRWTMDYAYRCLEKADEEKANITRENAIKWIKQYTGVTGEEVEPAELEGDVHETEERLE